MRVKMPDRGAKRALNPSGERPFQSPSIFDGTCWGNTSFEMATIVALGSTDWRYVESVLMTPCHKCESIRHHSFENLSFPDFVSGNIGCHRHGRIPCFSV